MANFIQVLSHNRMAVKIMEKNWSIEQTKRLFDYAFRATVQKKGLMWAFVQVAQESGKSINSVRNYYYSQLKMFELVPRLASELDIKVVNVQRDRFQLFGEQEINQLVKEILIGKANGVSVRATINQKSDGDSKLALRLQNKYRSMVANHKDKVVKIMDELGFDGIVYFNPYTKMVSSEMRAVSNHEKLIEYISELDEGKVDSVFEIFKKLFA